ncbi:hypothetical protein [Vreelandella boliviensis]|uniref:Uncharacterized protein n=1 Tax=Vreelandella boliviensis LC1 TaxID=1072583 RepID=A0A265DX47_9GAMM|nr:hypothetical protein [Halomonas boliviensis]EHJ91469.1 hypothetical protein KUC_3912 [Halomonas boliviensis LC1]OZT73902.1 hypothetical protein CE457_10580 [Halomonas boliviensis LC1]
MSKLNDQFDVLSNTLRLLPEEIIRLEYFIKGINEPEEGISNVEIACLNIFNSIYGMMCALKDAELVDSLYEHDAITTILCIRHILQHQSGRLKNNLRDAWSRSIQGAPVLIKYNVTDPGMADSPLYISVVWFQEGISNSNNAKRLPAINKFWNLEAIKEQVDASPHGDWSLTYICVMALITEAVRKIVTEYGNAITASGYDSNVYLDHFKTVNAIDPKDYGIIT